MGLDKSHVIGRWWHSHILDIWFFRGSRYGTARHVVCAFSK